MIGDLVDGNGNHIETGAPSGGPGQYPSDTPPSGHHWEWVNGGWQAVPDAAPPPPAPTDKGNPDPTPTPPPPTPPPGGSSVGPFTGTFNPSPPQTSLNLPPVPLPDLPTYTAPPAWKSPSVDEAMVDPSYQWRKSQGEQSLQRWAAARGTLNDSGTANALTDYGQNAASQEYQNIWNREWTGYNTNVQTQYVDPYKFKVQNALDMNAPKVLGWQTNVAATQHANDMTYGNEWARFLQDWTAWRDNRDTAIGLAGA